jgi:UDP-2,4-diacetamido-2,4,6-trideoxy-beta-L-altropyranose hydrolase
MKVVIRVDASIRMGMGHLVRCRTLASALRARGVAVRFVCRAHPGHQIDALRGDGYQVSILAEPPLREARDGDYAAWLGLSQTQDAVETLNALARERAADSATKRGAADTLADWLIVDHYGLDAEWERALRSRVSRLLVIDDLANRDHACDLLLDQNYAPEGEDRYAGRVSSEALCLLGPKYALLRPEYAEARRGLTRQYDKPDRVLVFFGGSDPDNLTGRALSALSGSALAHLKVDVVIGANNLHREHIIEQAKRRPNVQVYPPRPHLADLMAAADLCVGAGGATTWERCCLGLPSLVVSIADNQRPACEALAAAGLIHYLGHHDAVDAQTVREAAEALLTSPQNLEAISQASSSLVDGLGVQRVMSAMLDAAPSDRN